ncbi:hypothetical protein P5673_032800 [Acropora cervicornis]|uniref:Uncharacterized protein n=1 Tax=Acropora cervicornis TaxID=6130 RepID=A0AAD9PQU4_ACRCE|nr:hypothetical protein P5673_032800 [Acropora cervicornis]
MPTNLAGNAQCPRNNDDNAPAEKCVTKYNITTDDVPRHFTAKGNAKGLPPPSYQLNDAGLRLQSVGENILKNSKNTCFYRFGINLYNFCLNGVEVSGWGKGGGGVEGGSCTDRTNVCWVKEGCSSLKPKVCSSLPLEEVDHVDHFNAPKLNLHLNKGCYSSSKLQAQLDNAPASCNPPFFRITKPGEYCYTSTRNNNFSIRRHMGLITVT